MIQGTDTAPGVKANPSFGVRAAALDTLHELAHTFGDGPCPACERTRVLVITEARRLDRRARFAGRGRVRPW